MQKKQYTVHAMYTVLSLSLFLFSFLPVLLSSVDHSLVKAMGVFKKLQSIHY